MIKVANIEAELAKLAVLEGRTPETPDAEASAAFATLAPFGNGGVFTGSFNGDSPWERHTGGDELVHVLKGGAELTILSEDGAQVLDLKAGSLTVVPKGLWHRFHAPLGVTLLSVTPQPTDHSTADHPFVEKT